MIIPRPMLKALVLSIKPETWPELRSLIGQIIEIYDNEGPSGAQRALLALLDGKQWRV